MSTYNAVMIFVNLNNINEGIVGIFFTLNVILKLILRYSFKSIR